MQAAGAGVGGSQIFSLRGRQNFYPSNPLSWQKKSTIHFSKAPTKTVRVPIPSILGTIHFLSAQAPLLQPTPPPPPLERRVLELGSLGLLFQKRQQFFYPVDNFFKRATKKSTHQSAPIKYWGFAAGSPLCSMYAQSSKGKILGPRSLRLVFSSNWVGVGVASRVIRALMTEWKSNIGVVREVISTAEVESEELERFHFFRLHFRLCRLRSAYDLVKTRLSESEAETEG